MKSSPGLGSWPHHRHLPESAKVSQKRCTSTTVPSLSRSATGDAFSPLKTRLSVSRLPYLSDHLRPQAPLLVHIWQTCLSQTCVVNKVICQFPSISNLISVMNSAPELCRASYPPFRLPDKGDRTRLYVQQDAQHHFEPKLQSFPDFHQGWKCASRFSNLRYVGHYWHATAESIAPTWKQTRQPVDLGWFLWVYVRSRSWGEINDLSVYHIWPYSSGY